jgi:hypothetical protein
MKVLVATRMMVQLTTTPVEKQTNSLIATGYRHRHRWSIPDLQFLQTLRRSLPGTIEPPESHHQTSFASSFHVRRGMFGQTPILRIRRKWYPRGRKFTQAFKYVVDARAVAGSVLPATLQEIPNLAREPTSFHSLRSLRTLTVQDLSDGNPLRGTKEWDVPAQNFIHNHPERVTIRR